MFKSLSDLPLPKPMPNESTYLDERKKRLEFLPGCKENFEKYTNSNKRVSNPGYLPIKLDIENLSRCNFRCVMCQVSEWPKGQRARDLTFHEFQKIIDDNIGLVEIKIQGMGEPTLGKDEFYRMIKYARDRYIWVRTITNGSLLHLNDNSQKLLQSGVNEIQISIDGADKNTFEKIRVGGKYERVIDNVRNLNELAQKSNKNITKMWTVVQDQNINQLKDLIFLAEKMKFKSLVFSLDITDWGNPNWSDTIRQKNVSHIFNLNYANELYEIGTQLGIDVAFWNINNKYDLSDMENLCPWPFERSYITSDNRVVPCCMIADPDTFEIKGTGTFVEIWNSKKYQSFRETHLSGKLDKLPNICQNCYRK